MSRRQSLHGCQWKGWPQGCMHSRWIGNDDGNFWHGHARGWWIHGKWAIRLRMNPEHAPLSSSSAKNDTSYSLKNWGDLPPNYPRLINPMPHVRAILSFRPKHNSLRRNLGLFWRFICMPLKATQSNSLALHHDHSLKHYHTLSYWFNRHCGFDSETWRIPSSVRRGRMPCVEVTSVYSTVGNMQCHLDQNAQALFRQRRNIYLTRLEATG